MDDMAKMSPAILLPELYALATDKKNETRRDIFAKETIFDKKYTTEDCELASQLSMVVEALHIKIWPHDQCVVKFSTKERTFAVNLNRLKYRFAEYTIYARGLATKIKKVETSKSMYFDSTNSILYVEPNDSGKPDEATIVLMLTAGLLRDCYLDENPNAQWFGLPEHMEKINDIRLKTIAEYVLKKIKKQSSFDQIMIACWVGVLCQRWEGISINDLTHAITLSPKDVGIK